MKQFPYSVMATLLCVAISGTIDARNPLVAPATAVPAPAAQTGSALSPPQALILVRSGLGALEQANETGDYGALRAIGSRRFRADHPAGKLAGDFAALRGHDIAAVLVLDPTFTRTPQLGADRGVTMAGYFVSGGARIDFQLAYGTENGRWRLSAIDVGVHAVT